MDQSRIKFYLNGKVLNDVLSFWSSVLKKILKIVLSKPIQIDDKNSNFCLCLFPNVYFPILVVQVNKGVDY